MLKKYISRLNTFDDFYDITNNINLTTKQKGDLFEEFTLLLFKFHPNYINFTKNVWMYKDIPNYLFKKLNIPPKEEGIDLVLFSNDYKYYAIQSKFRQDKNVKIS